LKIVYQNVNRIWRTINGMVALLYITVYLQNLYVCSAVGIISFILL